MNVKLPKMVNEMLAEETGIHIGDGSMNYYQGHGLYSLRGNKITDRKFYEIHIKKIFETLYGANIRLREWKDVYGFQIASDKLIKFKNEIIGLPLGKKVNISIPQSLVKNNKLAIACVRGVFDTDGCIYIENKKGKPYPRIEIATTSEILAKQMKEIVNRNGIKCSLWKETYNNKKWKPKFMISIKGYNNFKLWYEVFGSSHPKNKEKFQALLKNLPPRRTC
jgi:DNA-binding transcriptional regulator WhiA